MIIDLDRSNGEEITQVGGIAKMLEYILWGKGSDRKEFVCTLFLHRNSVLDVIISRKVSINFIRI